jgi:hypothetical protein
MQSRRQSVAEVLTNTFVGMLGSWAITFASMVWIADRAAATTVAVVGCTAWSIVRGYWIRRRFAMLER